METEAGKRRIAASDERMKQVRSERAPPQEVAVEGAPRPSPVGERPRKQARIHDDVDKMDEDELFSEENVQRSIEPAQPARLSLEPVEADPYFDPDMEVSTPPMVAAPPP